MNNGAIEYQGRRIPFEIEYRKRKTMAIQIEPPGKVRVVAPWGVTQARIVARMQEKARWIADKLVLVESRAPVPQKEFVGGESLPYLGTDYPLQVCIDAKAAVAQVELVSHEFRIVAPRRDQQVLRATIEQWYISRTATELPGRVDAYAPRIGQRPSDVKVSRAKKRWGSCNGSGVLRMSWRCIMAPVEVFDYILVHEMCHLVHLNHSGEFYRLLASILPNYSVQRQWLADWGHTLTL